MKKNQQKNSPQAPQWADRFVRWYCSEMYQDEVLGDLHELFERKLEASSPTKAKWWYVWNSLLFMRLYNLKFMQNRFNFSNPIAMWKNYLKISYRHSIKNAPFIAINVVGLGLALACCIFAYVLVEFNLEFNQSFHNTENIYQVYMNGTSSQGKDEVISDRSLLTMGEKMTNELPGVSSYTRFIFQSDNISKGDEVFEETISYADPTFFDFFDFPLHSGNYQAFQNNPSAIYINGNVAKKYFGEEDPIGKMLYVYYEHEKETVEENGETVKEKVTEPVGFEVAGVFGKIPGNISFPTEVLVNIENLFKHKNIDKNSSDTWAKPATFVKLDHMASVDQTASQLQSFVTHYNEEVIQEWKISQFSLVPFMEIGAQREYLNQRAFNQYHIDAEPLYIFGGIAILILLVAVLNFTNTAMAFAQKRIREIGIRKVLGGIKAQIIRQFLFENLITCALALLLSLFFARVFMDWIARTGPPFELTYQNNYSMIGFLAVLLVVVSFISGIYPAFYIGNMNPSPILKGNFRTKDANTFTKTLLGLQFGISFIAVFSGIAMFQNAEYQEGLDLGYDNQNILYFSVDKEKAKPFLHDIQQVANVDSALISKNHITRWWRETTFNHNDQEQNVDFLEVSEGYLELMDVKLIEGTSFFASQEKGHMETAIINETLAKQFKDQNPIGQLVKVDSVEKYVIGVVQDIIYDGYDKVRGSNPMVIIPSKSEEGFLIIKTLPNQLDAALVDIKSVWKKHFPYQPFSGEEQAQLMEDSKLMGNIFKELFLFLSLLSTMLSISGLFALMSLTINRKVKEIGIRKVLGASFQQIFVLINKPYASIVVLAWLAGVSLGYMVSFKVILSRFKYHIDPGATPFIISLVVILLVTTITMGGKVLAAANANPSDTLRTE
ncbi:ABC transporter permease [Flammeovirgaceae bacterium SG7u.111]|nr:ABC transporter permease [Flammeovirgaceae bacterium SG7u.132]WPO33206.1 ABC transporter permease [Flammeovirgaceae bacterium SG7u.111]